MDRAIDGDEWRDSERPEPSLQTKDYPGAAAPRELQKERDDRSRFSPDTIATLCDLGRFRVIKSPDLAQKHYAGDPSRMQEELRGLARQGLVEGKTVWTGQHREKEMFWTLTNKGERLARGDGAVPPRQALYAGFVKPAELHHDAAVYAMYQKEAERLTKEGARIRRIVLDYELKKNVYSPLAKAKALPAAEYSRRQFEIAEEHGLKVVNGHIALPDLRVEYETADGGAQYIDLEVATSNYHSSHASEKATAGFRMYASPETAGRLSRALEERGIIAEIFSL